MIGARGRQGEVRFRTADEDERVKIRADLRYHAAHGPT